MASKRKAGAQALSKSNFTDTIFKISYRFPLSQVFDDFLTMTIAACTINPETKLSYYEDEYLKTIAKYKDSELRFEFPNAFAYLIEEMEARLQSEKGNDVLGDFFEQHISNGRNGQFFTPQHICDFMASITQSDAEAERENKKPLRILDPACGSGRMLFAAFKLYGTGHEYYGIDIDLMCVKMTALNFFLNGMWNSEVMCANALMPEDFVIAYHISLLPFGIFKIAEKERSRLWQLHKNSFIPIQKQPASTAFKPTAVSVHARKKDDPTQLLLF